MIDAPPHTNGHHKRDETAWSPVSGFAQLKRLPLSFLADHQIGDRDGGKVGFPYFDNDGSRLFERTRNPADYDCRFSHPKGVRVRPYGLWRLADWDDVSTLAITEGESDTLTLWLHDVPALGLPGTDTVGCLSLDDLAGVREILVCADNDDAGRQLLKKLPRHLQRIGYRGTAREVRVPAGHKDVSDLFASDPAGFVATWKRLYRRRGRCWCLGPSATRRANRLRARRGQTSGLGRGASGWTPSTRPSSSRGNTTSTTTSMTCWWPTSRPCWAGRARR